MIVPEHWLRDFVDWNMPVGKLAHGLTMSGLEVESCEPVAPPLPGVVVGEILSVARHPNADKLTVCTVKAGSETL
jgi:phenylalanyl-tRNA synthetase beta chain